MRHGVCDGVRGDVNVFTPNPQLKVYPVVVGINHYQAHSAERPIDLEFAVSDAQRVSAFLRQPNEAFACTDFQPFIDGLATAEAVRSRLHRLLRSSQIARGDVVFFYFAGHGMLKNGHAYLCCADVNLRDPGAGGGLQLDDLYYDLQNATAGTVIFVFDACVSGAFSDPGVVAVNVVQQFKSVLSIPPQAMSNRVIYAAAHSTQKAREHPFIDGGGGLFTSALLRGWRDGAAAEKGIVTPQSLQTYLLSSFDNFSEQQPVTVVTGDSVIVLGRFDPAAESAPRREEPRLPGGAGWIDHSLNVTPTGPTQPIGAVKPPQRPSRKVVIGGLVVAALLVVGASILVLESPAAFLIACAVALAIGFGSIASSGILKPLLVLLTIAQAALLFGEAHLRFDFLPGVSFLDTLASYAWLALLICLAQSLVILFRVFEEMTSN